MKLRSIISWSLLLALLLQGVAPSSKAQVSEREKEKREQELERKQQLERKTYVLVEEIANGALGLKLPENRCYLLTRSANLLWDHDEPRARNLFWDALNTLTLMITPGGNETGKPSVKEKQRDQSLYFQVFAMRESVLRQAARRDPQLALDMLRSSRQPPVESNSDFHWPDDRDLEQRIAAEVAARDPERALQLARESLAKGLSFQLLDSLYKLNYRNTELGTKFAGELIDKLRARDLATDLFAPRIAVALLTFSRSPKEFPDAKMPAPLTRPVKLSPEQRRELVDKITSAALEGSAQANLLFMLEAVMPEIQEFTPERVAALQRKVAGFNQTLNKEQRITQEYMSLAREGKSEEMLKLASRAPDDDRRWMQEQAVVIAVMRKRADSLREFLNSDIEDQGQRKTLLDMLDAEQIDSAVHQGNAEELRKVLPQIRRKEERARAMTEIAIVMEKNGNHDEALKLLDEAQIMIKLDLDSMTQTNAMLTLVGAYALVEPSRAFTLVERIVDRANDDLAKLLLLDKLVRSGMVQKGEIKLQESGMMPIDFAVFKYGKSVVALANADFDRTKAAADRFQRTEVRLMVRLLLAQALLRGNSQTNEVGSTSFELAGKL